jgi:SdrD B-like domain
MNRVRFSIVAIGLGFVFCSLPALAQFPGAVITTTEGGVAQTVFDSKSDVFFTAGPTATPCAATQFVNDGQYYFQVTDLSGATLLSSDPVSERLVTVHGGVLATYNGHTHDTNGADVPAEESSEESELVPFRGPCGALSVRLAPFRDAGSREASYLLWVTPVARFNGDPTQIDPVCGAGCFHGFRPELSLTSAFRVEDKRFCEDSFCVSGVKFEDRNGNGARDSGEPGLVGVEIIAEGENGGSRLRGLTGSDGAFQVCGLSHNDDFRITETVPFGFVQTAPRDHRPSQRLIAQDFGYFVDLCDSNFSGLDFGNQLIPNAIGGIKFEDLNANGVRDPGEPGLAGFTISLSSPSPGSPPLQTAVTDAAGHFLFTNVSPGSFVLTETQQQGFSLTVPALNSIPVTLASGGSSIANEFGNFRGVLTGTITGTKFLDTNANGVRDPGEPGQSGVTITRTATLNDPAGANLSVVTDAQGNFTFANVPFGNLTLSETVPSGFAQTAPPSPGTISAAINFANRTSSGNLFGNRALTGMVSGTKFNDVNGNGVRDSGEAGLAGVTIRATDASGTATTAVTDASGNFSITGLAAGAYVVSEVVPNGFTQTAPAAPGTFAVTLTTGQAVGNLLFGNRASTGPSDTASISGRKILDLNADGVFNGTDRGFEGIVFVLTDANGNTRQTTSDAQGNFTFSNLPAGTYVLSEVLPPNFFQTFPGTTGAPGTYTITVTTGQAATGFLFLNKC